MKKEIADKLVEALRSGEYQQGRCALRGSDNKFCCLGVLTDLYIKETGHGRWTPHDKDDCFVFHTDNEDDSADGENGFLPLEVIDWSGMHDKWGSAAGDRSIAPLYRMNDSDHTFEVIADKIEQHWKNL